MEKNIFVGVGGGTGSGKSFLTEILMEKRDARKIEMDDYYKGKDFVEQKIGGNFDHPDALDLKLLKKNILDLKEGKKTRKPIYDMTSSQRSGWEFVEPGVPVIVNGIFALFGRLSELWDISVYVDAKKEVMKRRRARRDKEMKRELSEREKNYFEEMAWPMHEKFVAPTKKMADIVVKNNKY